MSGAPVRFLLMELLDTATNGHYPGTQIAQFAQMGGRAGSEGYLKRISYIAKDWNLLPPEFHRNHMKSRPESDDRNG
jgi:hypothetical protein